MLGGWGGGGGGGAVEQEAPTARLINVLKLDKQ